jgi:hypothetical protein
MTDSYTLDELVVINMALNVYAEVVKDLIRRAGDARVTVHEGRETLAVINGLRARVVDTISEPAP